MTAADWNHHYAIGTPVHWIRSDGTVLATCTDSAARTLAGGLDAVGLTDSELPVLLTHVRPAVAPPSLSTEEI